MAVPSVFRKTLTMLGGNMAAVVLQALQFILLARTLGPHEYGAYVSINALVVIAVPLAGVGYGNVMLMHTSRDPRTAPLQLGNALAATWVMGAVLAAVIVLMAWAVYQGRTDLWLAAVVASAELLLVRTSQVLGQFFQALGQIRRLSRINVSISLCRVVAIGGLLLTTVPEALTWAVTAWVLLAANTAWQLRGALKLIPTLEVNTATLREQWSEALYFAFGTTAKAAYTDLDKVYLGRFAPVAEVGVYTTAYRLVVMAFIPVRSLLDVMAARFFKSGGQGGLNESYALSRNLLKVAVPYGICAGAGLYFAAPLLPWVLGAAYQDSVHVLRWLAPLPAIQAIHYVLSDALTGAGLQRVRTLLQFAVLAFYAALGYVLIPEHGWQGAALTCLLSEALLAVMVTVAVLLLVRQSSPTLKPHQS